MWFPFHPKMRLPRPCSWIVICWSCSFGRTFMAPSKIGIHSLHSNFSLVNQGEEFWQFPFPTQEEPTNRNWIHSASSDSSFEVLKYIHVSTQVHPCVFIKLRGAYHITTDSNGVTRESHSFSCACSKCQYSTTTPYKRKHPEAIRVTCFRRRSPCSCACACPSDSE